MAVTFAPPRVAIVGAGLMGRWHAHAAQRLGAQVRVVVDPDRAAGATLASRHPGCRAVTDLADALLEVDIVHVCSPAETHQVLAAQALGAGRHTLVEKPLSASVADTTALFEVAAAHQVQLCPVHQFPFQEGVRRALRESARLGPLRHVDLRICSAGADGADDVRRQQIAEEVLVHPFSLVERVWPGSAGSVDWQVRCPLSGELHVTGVFDDATVSIVVSMRGRPPVNRMELVGERGTAHLDLFHGFMTVDGGRSTRAGKAARPFTSAAAVGSAAAANLIRRARHGEAAYPGLRALIEAFYRAATGQAPPPIPRDEALAVATACERVARTCTVQSPYPHG